MESTGDCDHAEVDPWRISRSWAALVEHRITTDSPARLVCLAIEMVGVLNRALPWRNPEDRLRARLRAIYTLSELAQKGKCVDEMVENGVIPALVKHLQAPLPSVEGDNCEKSHKHEVERASAWALTLLTAKPEHRQLIVDGGALFHLLNLLKRHKAGSSSQSLNGLIRCAARAISELVRGNSRAGILVRMGGGILLLVKLLDADDIYVRGAAAKVLRLLAWENKETGNQIVDCGALPSIVLILKSDNADIHIKAVALISVLLSSSSNLKKDVLAAGALQPIIRLLSSSCVFSQMEAARLVELFAAVDPDCSLAIVQRGAVRPLIEMLRSPELKARELSASALSTLAQNSDTQVGIAHEGGLLALLGLLDSESESLQCVAIRALHTLLDTEDNVSDFITIGGFPKLQRGEFTAQATKIHVEGTVKKLEQKIRGPVFKHLLLLMRASENNTIQGRVAVALAHLSHPTNQRMIFIDNIGLKLLLGLLTSSCPEEQVDGALALFKLANNAIVISPAYADSPPPAPRVYLSEQYVNNAMQSDVTFLVESRQFYAHRICLCASSDTFCAMLDGAYKEKDTTTIEIPNIRWETFELMIRFMYSGSVEITPDIAPELLRAADQYLIEGLKRLCESAVAQEISMETISTIYELSEDFHATSLRHSCVLFILEHFHEFRHRYSHLMQGTVSAIRDHFSASGSSPMMASSGMYLPQNQCAFYALFISSIGTFFVSGKKKNMKMVIMTTKPPKKKRPNFRAQSMERNP
ncbi:ARM REPEAT PROTEIN INTERACTING WITH ABF2-like [Rhodamnia argentea]|uniref:ARM REPEAT PROTEIN INTERACTING WITH ABF2-like n=1 Tax=Rhodamnia argentea TaxID=178133 RepID=A0ABM3HHI3_9MYRT|nr:ARM REPEAT PROTEIN INTERACTING WITH ABF2-like [Rhodamnia argentea]